jgi:hypothetical protein
MGTGVIWPRGGAREVAGGRTPEGREGEELAELTSGDGRSGGV